MLQFGYCERCGAEDTLVSSCVVCSHQMCCECISCGRKCADCIARVNQSAEVCAKCGDRYGKHCNCTICNSEVCKNCVCYLYPDRHTSSLCKSCWLQFSMEVAVECGRCNELIKDESIRYYCEVCAAPLCSGCITASFECGMLKCLSCCSAPVRLLRDSQTRTVLDDELKCLLGSSLQSVQRTKKMTTTVSKYRRLRNRKLLGEGGQGAVFKCVTLDNEEVVSKEMTFADEDWNIYDAHLKQAQRMQKLSHKHLIRYLDVFGTKNPLMISVIMPYYSEGDLLKFIQRQRRPISEHKLCSIILQIATALDYLHSQKPPLAHRDIKPANILLLNREEQVLLMDLDLCGSCDTQPSTNTRTLFRQEGNSPTFEYRAPEMMLSAGSTKADIFSLGVVSFVLAALPEFPLLSNSVGTMAVLSDSGWTRDSLGRAIRRAINRHSSSYSEELIELIIEMVEHKPMLRPQASEVIVKLTTMMENQLLQ